MCDKICCTPFIVSAEYRLPSFDYFISESLNIVRMWDKICCTPSIVSADYRLPSFIFFHFRVFERSQDMWQDLLHPFYAFLWFFNIYFFDSLTCIYLFLHSIFPDNRCTKSDQQLSFLGRNIRPDCCLGKRFHAFFLFIEHRHPN